MEEGTGLFWTQGTLRKGQNRCKGGCHLLLAGIWRKDPVQAKAVLAPSVAGGNGPPLSRLHAHQARRYSFSWSQPTQHTDIPCIGDDTSRLAP